MYVIIIVGLYFDYIDRLLFIDKELLDIYSSVATPVLVILVMFAKVGPHY